MVLLWHFDISVPIILISFCYLYWIMLTCKSTVQSDSQIHDFYELVNFCESKTHRINGVFQFPKLITPMNWLIFVNQKHSTISVV